MSLERSSVSSGDALENGEASLHRTATSHFERWPQINSHFDAPKGACPEHRNIADIIRYGLYRLAPTTDDGVPPTLSFASGAVVGEVFRTLVAGRA